jgi:hypothetical protein
MPKQATNQAFMTQKKKKKTGLHVFYYYNQLAYAHWAVFSPVQPMPLKQLTHHYQNQPDCMRCLFISFVPTTSLIPPWHTCG